MSRNPRSVTYGNRAAPVSSTGGQAGLSTETVYRGRRDPTAPVGEELEVTGDA